MADCSKCGDPNCADVRAAAAREPWLDPCFVLGAQWYSVDSGMTWTREPPQRTGRPGSMTVTKIDRDRGEVTVCVTPPDWARKPVRRG